MGPVLSDSISQSTHRASSPAHHLMGVQALAPCPPSLISLLFPCASLCLSFFLPRLWALCLAEVPSSTIQGVWDLSQLPLIFSRCFPNFILSFGIRANWSLLINALKTTTYKIIMITTTCMIDATLTHAKAIMVDMATALVWEKKKTRLWGGPPSIE